MGGWDVPSWVPPLMREWAMAVAMMMVIRVVAERRTARVLASQGRVSRIWAMRGRETWVGGWVEEIDRG